MNLEIEMLIKKKEEILTTISNLDRCIGDEKLNGTYIEDRRGSLVDVIVEIDSRLNILYNFKNNDK